MKKASFNLAGAEQEASWPCVKEAGKAENKQSGRGFDVPVTSRVFDEDV